MYSNYEFVDALQKKTFTNEITSVEINSNKRTVLSGIATDPFP
jgi:hypothetical protein